MRSRRARKKRLKPLENKDATLYLTKEIIARDKANLQHKVCGRAASAGGRWAARMSEVSRLEGIERF